jgi:Zn-dependent protease
MNLQASDLVIVVVSILLSMGFHEAMHAFASHWLGDRTAYDMGRLTLNPLKHIDVFTTILLPVLLIAVGVPPFFIAKPVPFNPDELKYEEFGMALVGLAGPLTNLFLAGAAALAIRIINPDFLTGITYVLFVFLQVNIGFFVFNMIPFPPLDGSRLLYAFAPEPLQKVMLQIESFGLMAIFFFMFVLFTFLSPAVTYANNYLIRLLL